MSSLAAQPTTPLRYDLAYPDEIIVSAVFGGSTRLLVTVPGEWWLRLRTVSFTLATNALVATRIPQLQLVDANGLVAMTIPQASGQPASTTASYLWTADASTAWGASAASQVAPVYTGLIPAGFSVYIYTLNGVIPDQWTNIVALVEKIPTGPALPAEPAPAPTPLFL